MRLVTGLKRGGRGFEALFATAFVQKHLFDSTAAVPNRSAPQRDCGSKRAERGVFQACLTSVKPDLLWTLLPHCAYVTLHLYLTLILSEMGGQS